DFFKSASTFDRLIRSKSHLKAVPVRNLLRLYSALVVISVALLSSSSSMAQQAPQEESAVLHGYQKAPQPISDILNARPTPLVQVSRNGKWLLAADRLANPPITDLAQPMLRLAGIRINPTTNGRHHPPRFVHLRLFYTAGSEQADVTVPRNAYLSVPEWSQDSQHFVFSNTTTNGIELWVGQIGTYTATLVPKLRISAVLGDAFKWMPGGKTLLVQ